MEINIRNSNSSEENFRIVTWAANTTGNQRNDEICELAGFCMSNSNTSFSEYIMPYCNIKRKYWEQHGLIEINNRRIRFLLNSHERKVLNTKTELYGILEFLNWLEKVKGQSAGIILVCYEPHDYISQILLESLYRCRLNEYFSKIVKFSINCFDLCKAKYQDQVKFCSLSNVASMLFEENTDFIRAFSRAKVCHKIITHIKDENQFEELITSHIRPYSLKKQIESQDVKLEAIPIKEKKKPESKKATFKLNNESEVNKIETNEVNKFDIHKAKKECISPMNYLQCKIVGWASNTTGRKYKNEILHLAAFSPNAMFSQYIMPKKRIYSYTYRHRVRIIKENNTKYLKDLQTGKVLETNVGAAALKEFINWLVQIKDDGEGIIILYHEEKKYSLAILLETLRKCKLTDAFSNVVKGFVNTYNVSKDKCVDITNCFTLRNLSQLLLKKQIDIGDAMSRAKASYEIIDNLAEVKTELAEKNTDILNLVQSFLKTISDEEIELSQFKLKLNKERKLKSMEKANRSEFIDT